MKNGYKKLYGVVVLYNESGQLIKGEPHDIIAENEVIDCARTVYDALSQEYKAALVPIRTDVELAMANYPPKEWVVFNLGEGVDGRLFESARIAWALDAMGYCFTGSSGDSIARTTNKVTTKNILIKNHLPTPKGWVFRDTSDLNELNIFPLIVKPIAEDGSLGIESNAVVFNRDSLKERIDFVNKIYRQEALVESFISGREFNVAMWNNPPDILPLCEIDFSDFKNPYERIVSFAAKWECDSFEYNHTPGICPAPIKSSLYDLIAKISTDAWFALDCKDYARVDIRVDNNENPYIIEINCNPDLSPDAGFFRSASSAGNSYTDMVNKIVEFARNRFY
jgi:D-alanine-D-alanine ligase